MPRFFSKFFGSVRKTSAARLALEALESRWCPATARLNSAGLLEIVGTAGADVVSVVQDDATNRVLVSHDGVTDVFASDKVKSVAVRLGAGNDTFSYRLNSDMTRGKTLSLDLGTGNDTATLDFGKMKSHAVKSDLTINVLGGDGHDTVRADFGNQEGQKLSYSAALGAGDDKAEAFLWGVLRGTRATFDVKGEAGNDALSYYGDNGGHSGAALKVGLDGGDGSDSLSLFYDDALSHTVELSASGGKGSDGLVAQVNVRSATSAGSMTVKLDGGDDNDFLSLKMDEVFGKVATSFAGGAGNDIVQAEYGRPFGVGNIDVSKLDVQVDGGSGDDTVDVQQFGFLSNTSDVRIALHGRQGNDTLRYYQDNGSAAATKFNLLMEGNEGDDTMSVFFDDILSGATHIYVDAGAGNDAVSAVVNLAFPIGSANLVDLALVGGTGNDRLTFQSDALFSRLKLAMLGGTGNDVVNAGFGRIDSTVVSCFVDLGDGDDTGDVKLTGVLRFNGQFSHRMEGGAGNDVLRFRNDNDSGVDSQLSVALNGGAGHDRVSASVDKSVVGTHSYELNGGTGDDRMEATVNARSGSTGTLSIAVKGEQGRDAMGLAVVDSSGGLLRLTRADLDGGADADLLLFATPNVRRINVP